MLPESADRSTISGCVRQTPNLFAGFFAFAGTRAGGEHHGLVESRSVRDLNLLSVSIGAFAAIRPPARSQCRSAGDSRNDFAFVLDPQQRPEGRNTTGKFFGPVDWIDDQARSD